MSKKSVRRIRVSAENASGVKFSNYFDVYAVDHPKFDGILIPDIIAETGKYINAIDFSNRFLAGGEILGYELHNASRWLLISELGNLYGEHFSDGVLEDVYVTAYNEVGIACTNKFNMIFYEHPKFTNSIEHLFLETGKPMEPVDVKYNFHTGGTIEKYYLKGSDPWMKIDKYGVITGIPVSANYFQVTVYGKNPIGIAHSNTFTVEVYTNMPIFHGEILNQWAFIDDMYTLDVSGHFTTGGYVAEYSLINNPFWLTIDSNGVISGIPEGDDKLLSLEISVLAKNTSGEAASNTFTIEIQDDPRFIKDIELLTPTVDDPYYINIADHFENVDYYVLHNHPDWIEISIVGTLVGIPEYQGILHDIIIEGINKKGNVESNKITMDIRLVPVFLEIIEDIYMIEGETLKLDVNSYLNDATIDTYGLTSAPSWLSIDNNGIIDSVVEEGVNDVAILVDNHAALTESNFFRITVYAKIIFDGHIDNIEGIVGVPLIPVDMSQYFSSGGPVDSYDLKSMYEIFHAVPSWLHISENGILTGLPNAVDDIQDIFVVASNKAGAEKSNPFKITIK